MHDIYRYRQQPLEDVWTLCDFLPRPAGDGREPSAPSLQGDFIEKFVGRRQHQEESDGSEGRNGGNGDSGRQKQVAEDSRTVDDDSG